MSRLLLILLFCLPGTGTNCAAQAKKSFEIAAVAFYNFENLFDTLDDPRKFDEDFTPAGAYNYNTVIYRQKLHNLATVLQRLGTELSEDGPALIGTAEIENISVLRDLVREPEIATRGYRPVLIEGPDSRGIDPALLYNPKYFRLLAAGSHTVDISRSGEKSGRTRDILQVTGILLGDTVHVFVAHWPSRRGGETASAPLRAIAAAVAKRVIDSLAKINPETRVILMGDLNDDPVSPSVAKVLGAKGARNKVKPGGLFNPFVAFFEKGIGTLGYSDAWNLFDQIMVSHTWLMAEPGHWRYYKAEVFNRDFLKEKFGRYKGYPHRSFEGPVWLNGYSDHFPTLIYFVKEDLK